MGPVVWAHSWQLAALNLKPIYCWKSWTTDMQHAFLDTKTGNFPLQREKIRGLSSTRPMARRSRIGPGPCIPFIKSLCDFEQVTSLWASVPSFLKQAYWNSAVSTSDAPQKGTHTHNNNNNKVPPQIYWTPKPKVKYQHVYFLNAIGILMKTPR